MATVSRRGFLKSAAAVSSLMASHRALAQAGANERIRLAVIGCRNRGPLLAKGFLRNGRFEIPTMCDCDSVMYDRAVGALSKSSEHKPPKYEKDFRRVLDDKSIDAVAIATPDHWHACMAVMALAAGKHVYLEKPFSYNIADGKAVVAACQKHPKLVLQVGTQHRSCQHIRDAGEYIAAGNIGKVGMVRCWFVSQRPSIQRVPDSDPPASLDFDLWVGPAPMRAYNEQKVHYNWHYIRDLGTGEMGNWGAHWLDSARQMLNLDMPTSVSGLSNKVVDDLREWPDTATVLYEYPSLHILWELRQWTTHGINGRSGGVEVNGESGTVVMDRGGWWVHPKSDKKDKDSEVVAHKRTPMEEPHFENFAESIAGRAKPNAPAEEGFRSAVLCHLGNIASVLNCRVEFDAQSMSIKKDPQAQAMESREYRSPWKL